MYVINNCDVLVNVEQIYSECLPDCVLQQEIKYMPDNVNCYFI